MPRRVPVVLPAVALAAATVLGLAGCGTEPEALEPLPPAAPADLCALLPEAAVGDLTGTASSDDDGDPTAACALRGGTDASVLVIWLQLSDEAQATTAYESQCAAIDRRVLPEREAAVEGAGETCAGSGDGRASLALVSGREVVTVRADLPRGEDALGRATALADGLLEDLPRPQ
ncbi:hypothetical protein [Nocardioides aequoreus]|uniref:hypothetical protein n=1 Tax=Nocardioides aequoreus TaxID=397278 RepID=UPI0004C3B42A|nr:hypothetical protein [Nocardioides aequoreus]